MAARQFSDRARRGVLHANQEAQRFNSKLVDTEHLLMGLIKDGTGIAANVLKSFDVDLQKVHQEFERLVPKNPDALTMGRLPMAPGAKRVLEFALKEAQNLDNGNVDTEHILLGLLHEKEEVAAKILVSLGLQLDEVRHEVLKLIGHENNIATTNFTKGATSCNVVKQ